MMKITFQDALRASTAPKAILGACTNTPDGSSWLYTKANEAISLGHIVVPVAVTAVDTVSSSTNTDGQIVFITEAAAGWTAGEFINAWVNVDDGTGEGQVAKIKNNTADTLELYVDYALTTALNVSDSDITISRINTLSEKAAVTTTNQNARGAAQVAIASGSYGWVLTNGPGVVIAGAVITAGKNFTTGDDTEGQVILGVTAEGPFDAQCLGFSLAANSTVDLGFLADIAL